MIKKLYAATLSSLVLVSWVAAQPADLSAVQRQLAIFAGILEESLQLNDATGLFGMSLGGVETLYLREQGAVFEVRSPLANRRNRMGLASLSSAMQALQMRQNPFQALSLNAESAVAAQAAPVAEADTLQTGYRQLLDRIAAIDYSAITQGAMQQASQSARALRALDSLDDAAFAELNSEITAMRESLDSQLAGLRELELEIRERVMNSAGNDTSSQTFSSRLEALLGALEPIKNQALARAESLRQEAERAEQDYALAWQNDLDEFQRSLYETLCEYGDTLEILTQSESVSVILKGLGLEQGDNRRTDLIHIVAKADITACASGEISAASLQERATAYTY